MPRKSILTKYVNKTTYIYYCIYIYLYIYTLTYIRINFYLSTMQSHGICLYESIMMSIHTYILVCAFQQHAVSNVFLANQKRKAVTSGCFLVQVARDMLPQNSFHVAWHFSLLYWFLWRLKGGVNNNERWLANLRVLKSFTTSILFSVFMDFVAAF